MQAISGWLILASWLILVTYWCVSSFAAARSLGSRWIWWREIAVRLGFFAFALFVLQRSLAGPALSGLAFYAPEVGGLISLLGCGLAMLGVGFAIRGRGCLGSGWSRAAVGDSRILGDESRELVTTGPYARVRHPIYGGLLLVIVGSAIGQSALWLLPLIAYGPSFIASARREEQLLLERYPERYRAYMGRTKMLIPFLV